MNHEQLVARAAAWLEAKGCGVVITDMTSSAPETPDAIGWRFGVSTLIECKASRSDFRADAHKSFRRNPGDAMGDHRYYMAPWSLLTPEEVPAPWGLLEVRGRQVLVSKVAQRVSGSSRANEVQLLCSALRRLVAVPGCRGINVKTYTLETQGIPRARLGISVDEITEVGS